MILRRTLLLLLEGICLLAFFATVLIALMFVATETPSEAMAQGPGSVPAGCEVGFYTGGRYYCWYRLANHPILFSLTLVSMAALAAAMKGLLGISLSGVTPNKPLERTRDR